MATLMPLDNCLTLGAKRHAEMVSAAPWVCCDNRDAVLVRGWGLNDGDRAYVTSASPDANDWFARQFNAVHRCVTQFVKLPRSCECGVFTLRAIGGR